MWLEEYITSSCLLDSYKYQAFILSTILFYLTHNHTISSAKLTLLYHFRVIHPLPPTTTYPKLPTTPINMCCGFGSNKTPEAKKRSSPSAKAKGKQRRNDANSEDSFRTAWTKRRCKEHVEPCIGFPYSAYK
jgi:hypothetical protein